VKLQSPSLDDLPALAVFFRTLERYGIGGASESEVHDWLTSPMFDPALDFCMALEGDGVVGWCDVWDRNKARECFWLDVRTHPREQSTYQGLLDWGVGRAAELAAGSPGVARTLVDSEDAVFRDVVDRRGFSPVRYAFRMEIDLAEEPPTPEWPEGITVRSYRPSDARRIHEAEREVFADDWNFEALEFEDWQHLELDASGFDPALWFIAEEGDELAGFSLCRSERRPGTGHVRGLGVRSPWRRRGLGTALLRHSFRELRARGRLKADLGVDADNPTGAVQLYERVGMHAVYRIDTYEKKLS
jgi:mycothiol synthase